jgi:hypothetical protein
MAELVSPPPENDRFGVERKPDEFGSARYFVVNLTTGNWVSDAFDTADPAFDEADRMEEEASNNIPWRFSVSLPAQSEEGLDETLELPRPIVSRDVTPEGVRRAYEEASRLYAEESDQQVE